MVSCLHQPMFHKEFHMQLRIVFHGIAYGALCRIWATHFYLWLDKSGLRSRGGSDIVQERECLLLHRMLFVGKLSCGSIASDVQNQTSQVSVLHFVAKYNSRLSAANTSSISSHAEVMAKVVVWDSPSSTSERSAIPDISISQQRSLSTKFHSQALVVPEVHSETK